MHLLWFSANTGIASRITGINVPPPARPQLPIDTSTAFIKLMTRHIKAPFDMETMEQVKALVHSADPLSAYIYSLVINKQLPVTREEYNTVLPGAIRNEPFEVPATYGVPAFPSICQLYPIGVEAVVTVTRGVAYLKDKGGCPIGGFNTHLDAFTELGVYGDFNVIIKSGKNAEIYRRNVKGGNELASPSIPIYITDYQMASTPLSKRLQSIEAALISLDTEIVQMVPSILVKEAEDIRHLIARYGGNTHKEFRVIVRQDIEPRLWITGDHNIDITKYADSI
jgi:hypothetical protein